MESGRWTAKVRAVDHSEAVSNLNELLPAETALEVLHSLDPTQVGLYRIEGFHRRENGEFESRLDLILDFDHMQHFTRAEHIQIAQMFIRNRAIHDTYFELFAM